MTVRIRGIGEECAPFSKLAFVFLWSAVLLSGAPSASAQFCATPGKDGSPGTITGVVNTYYPGSASASAGATSITLGAATGAATSITSGDLLLVIQMQDASISSSNNSRYGDNVNGGAGSGYTNANGTGLYEFVKATNSVSAAGGTLTLQGAGTGSGLINTYTNAAATASQGQRRFQVVRVPQYTTVTLSSGLTALAWNGSTGGILAIDVVGNVSLNFSTVSVVGLGFRGGAGLQLQGAGGSNTDYRNTAPTSATTLTGFHGAKGEGIAGTPRYVWNAGSGVVVDTGVEGYPNGSMARGAPGTAGGGGTDGDPDTANPGGNDENSGGGGGGNGGAGGLGGNTWNSNLARGGYGGVVFADASTSRIVMGGGGGAGTRNNNPGDVAAASGAAGGGIVVIRAGAFVGFGTIDAGGAAAYNNTLNDGGGGGGAGGTVLVYSATGNPTGLTVNARGGRGGDAWRNQAPNGTPGERHGPGGGGGGGSIRLSGAAASTSVTGGANGITTTVSDTYGATAGANGATSTSLTAGQMPGVEPGALCPTGPTAIEMASYGANRLGKGKVLLEWETGYEVDNLGFNVYRQQGGGDKVRINKSMVAGSALFAGPGTRLTAGRSYIWRDKPPKGTDVTYWIEEIDMTGRSVWHGPVFVGEDDSTKEKYLLATNEVPDAKTIDEMNTESVEQGATLPVESAARLEMVGGTGLMKASGLGAAAVAWTLGSESAVKLSVKREGWYRVAASELQTAGLPPNADPRRLQLYVDGTEIPMRVITDGRGKLSAIEFYGIGIDTQSTDVHVYWLAAGSQNGKRIATVTGQGTSPVGNSFPYTVERRDRSIYLSGIRNGEAENFYGAVVVANPVNQVINLAGVDTGAFGQATVEVAMQGLSLLTHSVSVRLNGNYLGAIDFEGQANKRATFTVPMSSLMEGANTLTLQGQTTVLDVTLVDRIQVSYSRRFVAENNFLKLTAAGGQKITVGGFTRADVRVIDVTDPTGVSEVALTPNTGNAMTDGVTFSVPASGSRTLLAFAGDQVRAVAGAVANETSNWRSASRVADLVIITHKSLINSFVPLKSLRQSQGLEVAIVDVEDLYDEFSYGNKTPQAVKNFLSYARTNWKRGPAFVLLGGGASFDPKNYVGQGANDLVPTKLVDTEFMETASDDWHSDFNNDGLAEIAIGRLPANNPVEADAMVGKIVGYDASAASNSVTLTADENDDFSFEAASSQLKPLVPATMGTVEIARGQVGTAIARQQLMEALAAGQKLVNYTGHGSSTMWRSGFLTSNDARALTNSARLPMFVMMTCLNGLFQDANLDGLGPALIKSANGGAVAVWASSGLTEPPEQSTMNQELYRLLFPAAGVAPRLGEATMRAKATVKDSDLRRTWILFGDPSMRLR